MYQEVIRGALFLIGSDRPQDPNMDHFPLRAYEVSCAVEDNPACANFTPVAFLHLMDSDESYHGRHHR